MPGFDEDLAKATVNTETNGRGTTSARDEQSRARSEIKRTTGSLAAQFGRTYSSGKGSADLEELEHGLRETLEKLPEIKDSVEVLKINTSALRYPAVAVINRFQDIDKNECVGVFYYPLQDRTMALEQKHRDSRDDRKNVPPVPTDVIDNKFQNLVESEIRRKLNLSEKVIVHFAGQQLIGELFVLPFKDNASGYQDLMFAAVGQIEIVRLEEQDDTSGIIQGSMIQEDHVIVGRIDYTPSIAFDLAGNPVRSDINLQLIEQRKRGRDRDRDDLDSYNNEEGIGSKLIEVDAAVNFIFDNDDDRYEDDDRGRYRPQKFMAEIRVTRIDVRVQPTLSNFMYGLASIAAVTQNERWVNAFSPAVLRKNPNRNIGVLYIEQPERDMKPEAQDLTQETMEGIYKFCRYAVCKDVLVTFMAPESSEYSRISDMIYTMAVESRKSRAYLDIYDKLMDELEVMLGEPFEWNEEDPIFVSDQVHRSLIGHYPVGHEHHSTENVDYVSLAANENGKRSIENAQDWDESYGLDDYDAGTKRRADIVTEETDHMVRWTGAQSTVSISMKFLNALKAQLDDVNLGVEVDSMIDNSGRRARRSVSQFRAYAGQGEGFDGYRNDRRRNRDRDRDDRRGGSRRGRGRR